MALLPTALPNSFNPLDQGNIIAESAPAFVIRELTGDKRQIVLRERSLPYAGVEWSGTMRVKTTWYAGNPVATQQVLGPEEGPTTIEGTWKDRFVRGTIQQTGFRDVGYAQDVVEFFTDLRLAGQLLEVVWGPEVRRGILSEFSATYDRLQDIRWSATFDWQGRGPITPRAQEEGTEAPSLLDRINAVSENFALEPEFIFPDVNASLVSTIAEAREKTATVFGALRVVQRAASVPAQVLGSVNSAVDSLRNEVLEEINNIAEAPASLVSTSERTADVFEAEAWRRDMSSSLEALMDTLASAERTLEERAEPPATRVFQVPAESTLYAVSNRFYASPDFAGYLQQVNFLDSAVVPAGTTLIIPPKPGTDVAGA